MSVLPFHEFDETILDNASMSSASLVSDVLTLDRVTGYAINAVITNSSSPSGLLAIQGANVNDDIYYTDIKQFTVNSSSDTFLIDYDRPNYRFLRVKYTKTSGEGTLTVRVNGKR